MSVTEIESPVTLIPGDTFRLGKSKYEVRGTATVDASLVEMDGKKDTARQILYTCPDLCPCPETGFAWKLRTSAKAAGGEKFFTCPECGKRMDKGKANCDKPPQNGQQQQQGQPNPQNGNGQQGQQSQKGGQNGQQGAQQPSQDGQQGNGQGNGSSPLQDLKDALNELGQQAPKGKGKSPKGGGKGKGKGKGKAKLDGIAGAQQVAKDAVQSQTPQDVTVDVPTPSPSVNRCWNCECPTTAAPGEGGLTLCGTCESLRAEMLAALNEK